MRTESRISPSDEQLVDKAVSSEHLWFLLLQRDQDQQRNEIEKEKIIFEAGVIAQMDELPLERVIDRPDLVAEPVYEAIKNWEGTDPEEFMVFSSGSSLRTSEEVSASTGIPLSFGAKSLVVKVNGSDQHAVCVVPGDTRADLNGRVTKHLKVRQVSLAPTDSAEELTRMQTGSITPVGLPSRLPILVDERLSKKERIMMGSGLQSSKLIVPGAALLELPNVSQIMALGRTQIAA